MKHIINAALFTQAMVCLSVQAQTIALPYESVFKDYQTHQEVKLKDWKAANEEVRAAGGWRAYQREAQAPDTPNPNRAVPTKSEPISNEKPNTSVHQGHGK
jgi:hypothetical protein